MRRVRSRPSRHVAASTPHFRRPAAIGRYSESDVYRDLILGMGPALYWPMNLRGLTDQSGNARHGYFERFGTWTDANHYVGKFPDTPLRTDEMLSTEFRDQYAFLPGTSYVPFANGAGRTFMGWAWRRQTPGATGMGLVAAHNGSNAANLWMESNSLQAVGFGLRSGVGMSWAGAWPGNVQWVHWLLTSDEPNDTFEFFINGVSQGTRTSTGTYAGDAGFMVGQYWGGFAGRMAHVAVFHRILTLEEIQAAALVSVPAGTIKVLLGGSWAEKPVKHRAAGAFTQKPIQRL